MTFFIGNGQPWHTPKSAILKFKKNCNGDPLKILKVTSFASHVEEVS